MKLKKIASLMLAGIMAVSMLTACGGNTVDNKDDGDDNTTTVPASNASTVFEGALSTKANIKIDMADNATLNANLNTAIENLTSSTIKVFNTVNKGVMNFAVDGYYWVNEEGQLIGNVVDSIMGGDLKIIADEMGADAMWTSAFAALRPTFNEAEDETVTMLFAVDSAVSDNAAVKQVAKRLDGAISLLQIDDDVIDPSMPEPKALESSVENGVDWTTLHYEYSGSVSVASKVLTENHGMGMRIVAVQITRTAVA